MSSPPTTLPSPNLDATVGINFIGTFVAAVLWSGCLFQLGNYFSTYPKDRLLLKIWVSGVFGTATAGMILLCAVLYGSLVTNFGNLQTFSVIDPLGIWQITTMGLTAAQVQLFFVYRIAKLTSNLFVTIILVLCVLAQLASWLVLSALFLGDRFNSEQTFWTTESSVITMVLDIALAAALCSLLLLKKNGTRVARTQMVTRRLMLFALSSGLVTAFLALLVVVFALAFKGKNYYIGVYMPIQFLYANSMLATLNGRSYILDPIERATIEHGDNPRPTSIRLSGLPNFASRVTTDAPTEESSHITIQITSTIERDRGDDQNWTAKTGPTVKI